MKIFGRMWLAIGLISVGLGLCLLILATSVGFRIDGGDTYSFDESYANIRSLDIQIDYGEVNIVEGDTFMVSSDSLLEDGEFESVVSDGVWTIKESINKKVNIFGWRIPMLTFFGSDFLQEITITLPKGFVAEDVHLELGAGSLKADVIRSNTGDFEVDAGEIIIKQLEVSQESNYKIGTGHISLENVEVNNITIECGIGYVNIEGIVIGENKVSCDIGAVNLELIGNPKEYSYKIDSDIGNAIINGRSYHHKNINRKSNEMDRGSFDIECDIGQITLDID
ncbi:MAG TPA: DUF4097 family beta strand repeat-containing protein [Mobilitalea sp.]|nr:DUF4097 family beta strand repeat-containing protein [Mobilitalea sp.]